MINKQNCNNYPKVRTLKGINTVGLYTLIEKEVGRFIKVYTQTIIAPMITTLLFFTVFALAFGGANRMTEEGVPYLEFLAPGLIMMSMVQNAFANTSSSLVISKIQGNIVDILMPPISAGEILSGYLIGAVIRGFVIGIVTILAMAIFVHMNIHSIGIIILFALLGTILLGTLGIAAGIWSEKFDHIAAVTNFIVTPMTFLSGTFYKIDMLPEFWRFLAHANPFFYMIDGFRYGFIGEHDGNIYIGIVLLSGVNLLLIVLTYWMFRTGYKIKS